MIGAVSQALATLYKRPQSRCNFLSHETRPRGRLGEANLPGRIRTREVGAKCEISFKAIAEPS